MIKRIAMILGLVIVGATAAGCVVAPDHHRGRPGYYDNEYRRDRDRDRDRYERYDDRHDRDHWRNDRRDRW